MTRQHLPARWNKMSASEKRAWLEARGWHYLPDVSGATLTGGCWSHDRLGYVTNGGGVFGSIVTALAGIERFSAAIERC